MDEQTVTPEELTPDEEYEQAFAELTGASDTEDGLGKPETTADNAEIEDSDKPDDINEDDDSDTLIANEDDDSGESLDIWATATEEQRKAIEELRNEKSNWQHRFQSDAGRVSALQRKINELEALQSSRPQQVQEPVQVPIDPTSSAEMDSFREDYPDIANAVDRMVQQQLANERQQFQGALSQLDSRISQTIKPIQESEQQRFVDSQMKALEIEHPDWREVATSNDFMSWMVQQPEPVQAMYNSDSASDAAYLVSSFKQVNRSTPQVEHVSQTHGNQPTLQQAVTPRSRRTAPVTNAIPDDYESAFDYWVNKSGKS